MNINFPIPERPLEFVALFVVELRTKEGPAFMYVAYDPFSDKLFNLSVESEKSDNNLLKSIYYLAEDPFFAELNQSGFTLILDNHKNLAKKIETILLPINGVCEFDEAFNNYLSTPILKNLADFLQRKGG